MNLNVRISGGLRNHVTHELTEGSYENVSEYVRALIRRDKERAEKRAFERLRGELQLAFATPDDEYVPLSPADIFASREARES